MTTVAEEEQREVELDRLYFGRARDRQFEGLGNAQKAGASAGASKQNKKTRGKGKQLSATTQEDEKVAAGGDGWEGSFFFLQLADTQLGFYNDNQSWDKEIALATRAVRCINAMRPRPRFVVVCGDLVHAYPWEKPAYERQVDTITPAPAPATSSVRDFKRVMRKIDPSIPLVCLCGNHDVGNTPTRATIYSYKERFGDDYFRFWVGGVCCLVLNASLFADPSMALEEYEEQRAWFVQELQAFSRDRERTRAKHLLVFQHQPWFLEEPDEEDQYFNIPKERRMPMLEEMAKAGVRAVFAGHYHRNSYGTLGKMEMVTTSAVGRPLGVDPSGFRVVKVNEDGIEHAYYSLDRLEQSDTPDFEGEACLVSEMEPRRIERRFSVRSYVPADRDRVLQLFVEGMQENIETSPPDVRRVIEDSERKFIEWSLRDDLADIDAVYMSCTASPRSHFWVLVECIEDGEQDKREVIQGMVGLYRVNDDYAKVRRMSIAPAVRRQGLARRLLDHIIDYASKEGFRRVILSTGQYMSAANALYTTYGFIKTKEEPDEVGTMENHYEYDLVPHA